jgi:hypothetical protein
VKRAIVLALSVILALIVAAPTVLAQEEGPPNGEPPQVISGPVDPDDFPGTCAFPLDLVVNGKAKLILLPDGGAGVTSIATSPGLKVTITNGANPENQATFNITGSFHNSANTPETGLVTTRVTGRNLLSDPVAGTVIAIGNFNFVTDANTGDNVQPLDGKGQLIDVCALLA